MNPLFSRIHSDIFYGGQVLDSVGVLQQARPLWHRCSELGPIKFFDDKAPERLAGNVRGMWINESQADMAVEIIL
jgi:hypothetical protein